MKQAVGYVVIGAAAILLSSMSFAASDTDLSDRGYYGGALAGTVLTDDQRDARRYAPSVSLVGGRYLLDFLAAELHLFAQAPETRSSGQRAYAYGIGGGINLGEPEPYKPFALLGGGGLFENTPAASQQPVISPYIEYGVGLYLPNPFFDDTLIRADVRYNMIFHDVNDVGCLTLPCAKDKLGDLRFSLGFQFGSDYDTPAIAVPPPPAPPPPDSDNDGVPDSVDACPGTPAGTVVDAQGCPPPTTRLADSDGDGVPDNFDQCPNTPAGVVVDEKGCPLPPPAPTVIDSDSDGVPDTIDQCPNTPREFQVDEVGCVKVEKLVLQNVAFATGSAQLTAEGTASLSTVAESLKAHPSLVIEVDGHTDSVGGKDYNLKLSQKRANAVRDYLIAQGVAPERLTAAGFGLSMPIADNKTAEGRARNRRVEFKVLKQ